MANQNYGEGQQYDEDIINEQWVQQGKPQEFDEEHVRQGDMPGERPQQPGPGQQAQQHDDEEDQSRQARQGSTQEQWDQEHGGLTKEPFSPLDEEEEWEEEDISRLDKIE